MSDADWRALLTESHEQTGLVWSLLEADGGIRMTVGGRNELCELIRKNPDGLTQICSQTAAAMTAQLRHTRQPVVELCEAGMLRVTVPIIRNGEVVGQVAGCGLADDPAELDPELIALSLGLSADRVQSLLPAVRVIPRAAIEELSQKLMARLNPLPGQPPDERP